MRKSILPSNLTKRDLLLAASYSSLVISVSIHGRGTAFLFLFSLIIELIILMFFYNLLFLKSKDSTIRAQETFGVLCFIGMYYLIAYGLAGSVDGLELESLYGNIGGMVQPLLELGPYAIPSAIILFLGYYSEYRTMAKNHISKSNIQSAVFRHMVIIWFAGITGLIFSTAVNPKYLTYSLIGMAIARVWGEIAWGKVQGI